MVLGIWINGFYSDWKIILTVFVMILADEEFYNSDGSNLTWSIMWLRLPVV